MQLLQSGALWYLLIFMFNYDYTLDEGGVERNQEENRQEVIKTTITIIFILHDFFYNLILHLYSFKNSMYYIDALDQYDKSRVSVQ